MPVDPLAALGLLRSLFETIVNTLEKIRGTGKQQFARELVDLFSVFDQVERESLEVVSAIENLRNGGVEEIELLRIRARENIIGLQSACNDFLWWMHSHENWKNALEIFSPDTGKMLTRLKSQEDNPKFLELEWERDGIDFEITAILSRLPRELYHQNHPKPIPQPERLNLILDEVDQLLVDIRHTKDLIREFATTHLTIEDMF